MARLKMNMAQWERYHRRLAERFHPTAVKGARSAAMRVVRLAIDRTRRAPPANPAGLGTGGAVNTGEFVRAWRWLPLNDGARVLNDRPYAAVIEHGRRPGSPPPPMPPIRDWLIRRLGMKPAQAAAAAWPVARAIGRRGLLARRILSSEDARAEAQRILEAEVMHELNRELAKRP